MPQSPKSGSRLSVFGSTRAMSPDSPPTSGCLSANHAAANDPAIAIPNWMKSVTSTPQRPDVAAKATLIAAQMSSVLPIGQPSMTFAIFAAARLTDAMITQLKNSPRYTARNPRTKVAGRPE